jgi:DNA mismatch repair protein MutS
MVEMSEVSNILRHATEHSLLILDEIGRGTSTFDGLSIAWAVVEYISDKKIVGAKTLFATHYHELTQLEGQLSGVKNYCVAIKESGDDVIFLHKINPGSGDQSYGIEVAKLAGLPHWVLDRAHEILDELLDHDIAKRASNIVAKSSASDMDDADNEEQMSLFAPGAESGEAANMAVAAVSSSQMAVIQELQEIDVNRLTPLEAMQLIYDWQEKVRSL